MIKQCNVCGKSVRWCVTANGRPILMDADPTEAGTFQLDFSETVNEIGARFVAEPERGRAPEHSLYAVHREHCQPIAIRGAA